ncbi:MAG TPA: hypothetical protein VNK46_05370 [Nitrospiraceae bacterium]|nr:hypothetical protein [Nitrospiraceae bacterium]
MIIEFDIGGYRVRLEERDDCPLISWPANPFAAFVIQAAEPLDRHVDLHVTVTLVRALPDFPERSLRFDACHGLWALYESQSGYMLEALDTQTFAPRSRSWIDASFSRVHTWITEQTVEGTSGWSPVQILNPLVEVCLVTRLARDGGVLLHAAGVLTSAGGVTFTGPSGAGKSTLSGWYAARGATVLSDERTILRRHGHGVMLHGTPWVGSGRFAAHNSGPLSRVYCVRHGQDRHSMTPLSAPALFRFLLGQCVLPLWDREGLEGALSFLSELAERVGGADLAFLNTPDVVDYLETDGIPSSGVAR